MVSRRCSGPLVACRACPCGRPVDRSTDHRGAHPAPFAGLDSPQAVSRTLQIHSALPNLAKSPARCHRGGGRAVLSAPFDWHAIQIAAQDDMEGGRMRGGSTITQQLIKNLFFGTGRSILRKGAEFTLVPVAELVLGKRRVLELYLNVVEWGPGIYGADSACYYFYKTSTRRVDRVQSAQLAVILPLPLKRRPERMTHYSALILERMRQMGW